MSSRERTAWVISSTIEYADYTIGANRHLHEPGRHGEHGALKVLSVIFVSPWVVSGGEVSTDGISELCCARRASEIARPHPVIGKHGAERLHDPVRHRRFADVLQHQER